MNEDFQLFNQTSCAIVYYNYYRCITHVIIDFFRNEKKKKLVASLINKQLH